MSKEDDININININVNTENKIITTTVNGKPYHSANVSTESSGEKPLDIVSIKMVRRMSLKLYDLQCLNITEC
jgi:hypothetical protein